MKCIYYDLRRAIAGRWFLAALIATTVALYLSVGQATYRHHVHGAVANITEHIHTFEIGQVTDNGGKALGKYVHADDADAVLFPFEGEYDLFTGGVLHEILFEIVLLLCHPGQGQAHSQVNIRRLPTVKGQLGCDASQSQDEIIGIVHFVGSEFLVLFADGVVPAVIEQQIAFEGGFLLMPGYASLETGVRRFHVAVAMIQANDDWTVRGIVISYHIIVSFLPS